MEVIVNRKNFSQKVFRNRIPGLALGVLASFLYLAAPAQDFSGYMDYAELSDQLSSIAAEHRSTASLESIGQTVSGKDIWLMTLANRSGTDLADRPAILIAANLEANQLVGAELSVRMIQNLLADYPDDPAVAQLLNEHVVYFLPRINPDGADQFLQSPAGFSRINKHPYDSDNDGRMDEDGAEDLNNDGLISFMRVIDPEGKYCEDPEEPALLKRADPAKGETGKYTVYWEGLDNDGDGFINEDPTGGTDINRNFAHEYPYYQPDAGLHMVSENETRAVMDWMITHRNVAIILTFSESDNLLNPPDNRGRLNSDREIAMLSFADASNADASKVGMVRDRSFGRYGMYGSYYSRSGEDQSSRQRRPSRKAATTYNPDDLPYYTKLSREYKEITGIKVAPPLRTPKGAFSEYGYFQFGVLSLTTPGWGLPEAEDTTQAENRNRRSGRQMPSRTMDGASGNGDASGTDAELYRYFQNNQLNGFVEWTPFNHPELGEVEIGGFIPMAVFNPPASRLDDLADKQSDFLLSLSELFPRLIISSTEVTDHGDGLFRVKARVSNQGFLPTALQHGVVSRAVNPVMVRLEIDPARIISGNEKLNFIQKLDGSGQTESFEWLVKGKRGETISLKAVSQKGGSDIKKVKLQ